MVKRKKRTVKMESKRTTQICLTRRDNLNLLTNATLQLKKTEVRKIFPSSFDKYLLTNLPRKTKD
jgi:hypothetical protein